MTPLPDEHVAKVCQPGKGAATCRYLTMTPMKPSAGWTCVKLVPGLKAYLDDRVARETIRARGDNCEGR